MRKKIPAGSVFQRTYRDSKGNRRRTATWFINYYARGKQVRLPTGTTDRQEAISILREKVAKSARYTKSEHVELVLVNQLLNLVIDDYRLGDRSTTYDADRRIEKHLRPFFGKTKAIAVTTAAIKKYTSMRARQAAPATVNKELAYLRRAFRLGFQNEPRLVEKVPKFVMLPVDNARTGFVMHESYRTIRDSLPSYARVAFVISYHTGARKGEVAKIRTDKIDFTRARIDLPGRTTKNKKPRYLPIYGDMKAELAKALSVANPTCPFLIQNRGQRVVDWEKSWKAACATAGVPEVLFHDLRRTALTNMIEAGFSEKEAMEISGHKTRSVFDRYHIVCERRLRQLGERLEAHMRLKDEEAIVASEHGQ